MAGGGGSRGGGGGGVRMIKNGKDDADPSASMVRRVNQAAHANGMFNTFLRQGLCTLAPLLHRILDPTPTLDRVLA